jgi:uncharacterized membrane protein HdeD (DUF308 family)
MDIQEKVNLITMVLFLLTGILHLLMPFFYPMRFEIIASIIYGIIYTILGILVQIKKDNKVIAILSIILPLIGLIAGTVALLPMMDVYILFLLILDPILIILRIYIYRTL